MAGTIGVLALLVGWKRPFVPLAGLVLAVPFRDFSTRWMNVHTDLTVAEVTAIGRWWFALIVALLVLSGARWARDRWAARRLPVPGWTDGLFAAVIVVGAIATLTSPAPGAAFTSFRGYVQPLAVFVLARLIRPAKRDLRTLIVLWLAVGLVVAVFALVQVASWDEGHYRAEGYLRQDGALVVPYATIGGSRYLRPASTVSGPNELGMDMVVLALISLFLLDGEHGVRRVWLTGLVLLFVAGLAVTVSRSALLGFLVGLLALSMLYWGRFRGKVATLSKGRRVRAILVGAAGLTAIVFVMSLSGMVSVIARTAGNLTNEYHFVDSMQAVQYLLEHPQGVGMGLVEPKGALSLIEAGGRYHVEGSIFQIAMEMGVWGLGIWLAFWGTTLARVWRNWRTVTARELRVVTGTAFASWLGSLVAFLFLPLMQSVSLMVWLWFLLGAGYAADRIQAAWASARTEPVGRATATSHAVEAAGWG